MRILILCFVFFGIVINAQKQILKFDTKICYDFFYVSDSLKTEIKHHEKMILFFSKNESIFQSEKKFRIDSLMSTVRDGTTKRPLLKVSNVIYKNLDRKSTNVIYSELVNGVNLAYYDDSKNLKWSIKQAAAKKIANYDCKQAVAEYKGRSYVAWYTEALSLPHGPYKFGDLPGVILEIYDLDGFFHYKATNVQHSNFEVTYNTNYKVLEKNVFLKNKIDYLSSIFKPFVYNPIELKP